MYYIIHKPYGVMVQKRPDQALLFYVGDRSLKPACTRPLLSIVGREIMDSVFVELKHFTV